MIGVGCRFIYRNGGGFFKRYCLREIERGNFNFLKEEEFKGYYLYF